MSETSQTKETSQEIAKNLLEIEAVMLRANEADYFTWASGIKSPIYCNNRLTLSQPETRNLIRDSFTKLIREKFPQAQAISGVATAGIAHGALIADQLNLPFSYVRPKPKDHGTGDQIEGKINPGDKVVVVEDLISTGGSSLKAIEALKKAGVEVLGLVAIFTYNLPKAQQNFAEAKIPYYTLSDYDNLIELAQANGDLTDEQISRLKDWRASL